MRRGPGMGRDALGIAKIVREIDKRQRIEKAEGCLLAALHFERDDRSSRAHLPARERNLRVALEEGVVDAADPGVAFEEAGDARCVLVVPLEPELHRLE